METLVKRFVVTSIALFVAIAASASSQAQNGRRGEAYFTNLPVVNQDGKALRFYDDVIKDKVVVISFIFTACRDICPITTSRLAQVEDRLGDAVGRDVFFYSITVDPVNDTPEKLKQYAKAFHAGPGWQFLTGKLADIRTINGKLGERMRSLTEHRNEILIGNGATGEWQRSNVFGDLDNVIESIRAMDPKWRAQVRTPSKDNAEMTSLKFEGPPGQALFIRLCAGCHTVGQGDRVGPDLNGVTSRHGRAWLSRFIQQPEQVRASQDPAALALVARFPTVRMPNMGLTESDADDLLSYVELQMYRLSSPPPSNAKALPQRHHHHHH